MPLNKTKSINNETILLYNNYLINAILKQDHKKYVFAFLTSLPQLQQQRNTGNWTTRGLDNSWMPPLTVAVNMLKIINAWIL